MIHLLAKDFKLVFASGRAGKWRILSYLITALLVAIFVSIETYIVAGILSRLKSYVDVPIAFLSIALFIVSLLMTVLCLVQAKKLFFNDRDSVNLSYLPVKNKQIILSKLIFLFLTQYISGLVFTYPIIAAYNSMFGSGKMTYFFALFYPVLSFPFECGAALLLVYPYKLLSDFLKKRPWVQFAVAVVAIFSMSYLYSVVLKLFVSLVASNNFSAIINIESVNGMIAARRFMVPIGWLTDLFLLGNFRLFLIYLCVAGGVFLLGVTVCISSFGYLRSVRFQTRPRTRKTVYKRRSPTVALLRKEFLLLFKDTSNLFSFTGLVLVMPFLVELIVSAINTIFRTGVFAYYVALLPNFLPIVDLLLVILISLIISSGATGYISQEKKTIRLIKLLPAGAFKQLLVKAGLPLMFISASVIVSFLVLAVCGEVSLITALFGLLITLMIQVIYSMISLYEEVQTRGTRARSYFISSAFSYLIPILYAAAMIVAGYFGLQLYIEYLIGVGVIAASGLPWAIGFRKRIVRSFNRMEVIN